MDNDLALMSYDRITAFSFFLAFLRYKVDVDGEKQIDIANAAQVRTEYINRIYKGHQRCSVNVQEKVCRYFGRSYLEVLATGKQLKETGNLSATDAAQQQVTGSDTPDHNRKSNDTTHETDIVAFVSHWAAKNKETEEKLLKLQNIIENLSEGIVILNNELVIEYQNRTHREMFGGTHIGESYDTAKFCSNYLDECPSMASRRTGMPAGAIFPYDKGTVSAMTTPIRNLSGEITGYVTVFRDITERQKLMTMSQKTLEMLDRGVILCDDNSNINFYNSKFKEITGAGDKDLKSLETFQKYLTESKIMKNLDVFTKEIKDASDNRKEVNVTVHLRNGKTFIYTAKPIFTSTNTFIGRMGTLSPFD